MNKTEIIDLLPLVEKAMIVPKDGFEIIEENGKYYVIKKNPVYPKTYNDCCDYIPLVDSVKIARMIPSKHALLLEKFSKLLICRDTYWKIAGEEMGLDKPWEPDWNDRNNGKHCIFWDLGEIVCDELVRQKKNLAFPTAEMRDAFYENFKELIENCKELL